MAAYLTEFVSATIKKEKLDVGGFNRIIFEETEKTDIQPIVNGALCISVSKTFPGFDSIQSGEEAHNYFSRKYIEGLKKLDANFGSNTASLIENAIKIGFSQGPHYEKQLSSRGGSRVVGRWLSSEYQVVLRKGSLNDIIIYRCEPDPFVIAFEVHRVVATESEVVIMNKIREVTVRHAISNGT